MGHFNILSFITLPCRRKAEQTPLSKRQRTTGSDRSKWYFMKLYFWEIASKQQKQQHLIQRADTD